MNIRGFITRGIEQGNRCRTNQEAVAEKLLDWRIGSPRVQPHQSEQRRGGAIHAGPGCRHLGRERNEDFNLELPPSTQVSTSRYSSGTTAIIRGELRGLLSPKVNTLPLVRSIGRTMTQGKTYGPQITVKRISTK